MAQLKGQISKNFLSPPPPRPQETPSKFALRGNACKTKKKIKKGTKIGEKHDFLERGGGKISKQNIHPKDRLYKFQGRIQLFQRIQSPLK